MSWLDDLLYGYRTIRNALGADSPTRAALKIVGATVADDPTTGATIITIAGGTPLATLAGAGFVHVDSTDAQNPVVSLSPAPTAAATPETLVARDASGDAFFADVYASNGFVATAGGNLDLHQATAVGGDGAEGVVTAQAGTQSGDHDGGRLRLSGGLGHGTGANGGATLEVGGVPVLEVYEEPAFGGAKVARLGSVGGVAGLVIEGTTTTCEVQYFPRSTAGNGSNLNFSGQDATDGNGGGISFVGGAKGGSGTKDGKVTIGAGGVEYLKVDDGLVTVGNISNSSTASTKIAGPVGTTVGAAGGASALPAAPTGYLRIRVQGTDRLLPFYDTP